MQDMSRQNKLIQRINSIGDISFDEAKRLLTELGYNSASSGSHHTFRKPGKSLITIVFRNPIHRDAVRELRKIMIQEGLIK